MNLLTDDLPSTVQIHGVDYLINTSFFVWVKIEQILCDDIDEGDKAALILSLCYPVVPRNVQAALKQMLWFYACGKEIEDEKDGGKKRSPVYSFVEDDAFIYAAFLQQYGIDLTESTMHWWKFRALFSAISEDTRFGYAMKIRGMVLPRGMNKAEKDHYNELKRIYALRESGHAKNREEYERNMLEYVNKRYEEAERQKDGR